MNPELRRTGGRVGISLVVMLVFSGGLFAADTAPLDRGEKAYSRGEYRRALSVFRKAVEREGTDPRIHFRLGQTHARLGNDRRAVSSFQRALELDPEHTDARRALAHLYFKRGEWELASRQYRELTRRDSAGADDYYTLGVSLFRRNQLRRAQTYLRKARELAPSNPQVHYYLGRIELYHGNNRRGIRDFTRAIRYKRKGQYLFYRGLAYFRQQDYLESERERWKSGRNFRAALETGYGGSRARFMLGNTLLNRGLFHLKNDRSAKGRPLLERAIRQYRRVLIEDWEASNAYHNLGVAYLALGKYALAHRSLRMAIREEPDVAFFYDTLGMIHEGRGQTDRAIEAWKRVKQLAPRYRNHPFSPLLPVEPIPGKLRQARLNQ